MAIQNLVPTEGMIDGDERRTSIRPLSKEYARIRPAAQLSVIVAADMRGAIGLRGGMLWHLRDDLRRFKAITTGKAVIMGRKTWQSLPRRPLPGRLNVVITRQSDFVAEGARVAGSLTEAIGIAAGCEEIFIIGGGEIYRQALGMATRLYMTRIGGGRHVLSGGERRRMDAYGAGISRLGRGDAGVPLRELCAHRARPKNRRGGEC